jgi:hypothetical protein
MAEHSEAKNAIEASRWKFAGLSPFLRILGGQLIGLFQRKINFGLYLQAEGYACVRMLDMHRKSTLFSDKMSSFHVLVFCSRIKTWTSNSKPSHGLLISSSFVIQIQQLEKLKLRKETKLYLLDSEIHFGE